MSTGQRSPVEVVEEWQRRAWAECDLSVVDELLPDPVVRHGMAGTVRRSRAGMKDDISRYQEALGRPVIEVLDRTVDGDKVWSRTKMRGANLRTGEPRVVDWLQIHRVVDGRIVEVWTLSATDVDWER